jgi:osmotically-inducible protein OsmY
MYRKLTIWCAAMCLALAAGTAAAGQPQGDREAGVDDTVISGAITQAYEQDPLLAQYGIYVESYRGAVQLSGRVATAEQRTRAEQIASRAPGVRSVKNEIELGQQTQMQPGDPTRSSAEPSPTPR